MGVAEEFGYAQHSGRFDRSAALLVSAAQEIIKIPLVAIISFTEIDRAIRNTALRKGLDARGWKLVHLEKFDELGIAYDPEVFDLVYKVEKKLIDIPGGPHQRGEMRALFVLLKYKDTGRTYIASVAHTPAHLSDPARRRAHEQGMRAWNRELRRLTMLWKPTGGRIVSMDLNMDAERKIVRVYLARMFPTLRLIVDADWENTHDKRTIDVILIGRRLNPLKWFRGDRLMVLGTKDSDHKTVIAQLRRKG